jgi:hypothetical protein
MLQTDISKVVIAQMKERHAKYSNLTYVVSDCRDMPEFLDCQFRHVVDKGEEQQQQQPTSAISVGSLRSNHMFALALVPTVHHQQHLQHAQQQLRCPMQGQLVPWLLAATATTAAAGSCILAWFSTAASAAHGSSSNGVLPWHSRSLLPLAGTIDALLCCKQGTENVMRMLLEAYR